MSETTTPFVMPYPNDALEPVLSARQIELHTALARGYRDNFPIAISAVPQSAGSASSMRAALRDESFQGGGYILHQIYFSNMAPEGQGGEPGAVTSTALREAFSSTDEFRTLFTAAALAIEGPGWATLAWFQPINRLLIMGIEKHNDTFVPGALPVLTLDVWEHAYLLDYGTDRAAYVDAWWRVLNWNNVEERMQAAMIGAIPLIAGQ